MKILKQPQCQVFDTENPEKVGYDFSVKSNLLIPLHHLIVQTDWDFLKEKFGEKHIILEDFGNAYYYEILQVSFQSGKYKIIVENGKSDLYINNKYQHSIDRELTEEEAEKEFELAASTFDFSYHEPE